MAADVLLSFGNTAAALTRCGSVTGRIVGSTAVVNVDVVGTVAQRTTVDQLTRVSVRTARLVVTLALKSGSF